MITVTNGAQVELGVDGGQSGIMGYIESVDEEILAVRLDDDQPPRPLAAHTAVTFTVMSDTGLALMQTRVRETQAGGRRIRLVRPRDLVRRDRRAADRICTNRPLLWSQLDSEGQLTDRRYGITRDVSLSGMCFETHTNPPRIGAIVAVSSVDDDDNGAVLVRVVGVDDSPPEHLNHVVRCSLKTVLSTASSELQKFMNSPQ